MAFSYSENLANFEQWTYRQSFVDDSSWMSSIQETETLTKALQQSFSSDYYYSSEETPLAVHQQQFVKPEPIPTTTPTVSGSDDPETTSTTTTTLKQQRRGNNNHQTLKGKISKRKSRATNRSPITFITADPMNFRQMVQQVTGIRIGGGGGGANGGGEGDLHMPVTQIMKPEAKRPGDLRLMNGGYTLPTLDTSAFLLEQQQQQQQQQLMGSTTSSTVTSPTHVVSYHAAPVVVAQVNTSFDFGTFQSFPTLESWGVI